MVLDGSRHEVLGRVPIAMPGGHVARVDEKEDRRGGQVLSGDAAQCARQVGRAVAGADDYGSG